ncbi:MAG: hypothetical protein ACNA8W_01745 [Bradymonadaceae bacterium]
MKTQDEIIARLMDEGLIDETGVELAREQQQSHGHRLASHLLAMGYLEEKALLRSQAEALSMAPADYADGVDIDAALLKELGQELVRTYGLVPIKSDKGPLFFTSLPVDASELANVEEKLGATVRTFFWPELRQLQAMHNALGDRLPEWARGFYKENPIRMTYHKSAATSDIAEALRSSLSLGSEWTLEELSEFIAACFDRDTLLKVLLGYSGQWITNRMIAVISKVGLQPYFLEDWVSLDPRLEALREVRKIQVKVDPKGRAFIESGLIMGSPGALGIDELFESLDVTQPSLAVVIPICIGSRTAMLLIGVPTSRQRSMRLEEASESFDTTELEEAASAVGLQLEELIKRAKASTLPPTSERIPPLPERIVTALTKRAETVVAAEAEEKKPAFSGPVSQVHQTQQLWAVEKPDDGDESDVAREPSVPGHALTGESHPRQTILIQDFSDRKVDKVTAPLIESESSDPGRTNFGMPAPEPESLDPGQTNFGRPALEIEELSDALLAEPEGPISEVDDGWDDLLGTASSAVSDGEMPGPAPGENTFEDAPTSGRTLMGGFSMPPGAIQAKLEEQQEARKDVNEAKPPPQQAPPEEGVEESEPPPEEPAMPTSSSHLPGAQIFKRSRIQSKSVPSAAMASAQDSAKPTETARHPTVPMAAVLTPASPPIEEKDSSLEEKSRALEELSKALEEKFNALEEKSKALEEKSKALEELSKASDENGPLDFDEDEVIDEFFGPGVQEPGEDAFDLGVGPEPDDAPADPHAWLDDFKEQGESPRYEEEGKDTVNTMRLEGAATRTQSFGHLMREMSDDAPGPLTIPPEALEELLDSGPIAVDLEQSLAMLDSRDPKVARAAAEHVATLGVRALDVLESLFPGRLFVDRYQHTFQTLPPVAEHGAVLDALVRIGSPAISLVQKFLDHQSIELRFYATFLLTELPADGLLDSLYERLFDRDQQTRQLAQKIIGYQRHTPDFEQKILAKLRADTSAGQEDARVEIAAENLRVARDVNAVGGLIDALGEHGGRVQLKIYTALRHITLQPIPMNVSAWRNWWYDACQEPRSKWLINALNANDQELRYMVFDEIQQIPGLELNYHPDQPPGLRVRAEKDLAEFLETFHTR